MIWLILAISFILRIIGLNQSLWLDEAINVNAATFLNFKTLILNYSLGDFHPPLFHIVLKSWILIFGPSEISVRTPSIIFGVGTVFITYLIGKKLFDKKTGLIAATLLATAPLHIYYSQEARMYAMAAFFVSLAIYFLVSLLEKNSIFNWLGFITASVLALYTDYLPYLMLPIIFVYLILVRKKIAKGTLSSFIPALVLIVFFLAPWLLIFPRQFNTGLLAAAASPAWSHVVGGASFKNLVVSFVKFTIGRISSDNHVFYVVSFIPAAILTTLLFLFSLFRMNWKRFFLWFWFFTPVFIAFIIAYFIPIFAYFRFLFVLPAFYLILASGINTVNWVLPTRILLLGAIAINLVSVTIFLANPKFQREDWRGAVSYIQKNSTPSTITLFESNYTIAPFDYYNKSHLEAHGALDSFSPKESKVKENVAKFTKNKQRIFLFQYLSEITDQDGLAYKELTDKGFKNTSTVNFEGVGFIYEFTK